MALNIGNPTQVYNNTDLQQNIGSAIATTAQANQAINRWILHTRRAPTNNPNNPNSERAMFGAILVFAANTGLGNKSYWDSKVITWLDHNGAARRVNATNIWTRIVEDPDNDGAADGFAHSARALFRRFDSYALEIGRKSPDSYTRATAMCLPNDYAYLACDFLDRSKLLSPDEIQAIDCAKQMMLFRSQTHKSVNMSNHYNGASVSTSAGAIEANSKALTFRRQ